MPVSQGGSTGGGSTTEICTVSPSDLAGQIDNLITRIERLEQAVSEILGADVTAIQLSDLSQSVGWVYDVTYMGIDGWIQTAAGTLIPPPGFTVSEILAAAQAGQLSTSGGGVNRLVRTNMDYRSLVNAAGLVDLYYTNPSNYNDTIGATFSTSYFTLPRTGYYFISARIEFQDISYIRNGALSVYLTSNSSPGVLGWANAWTSAAGNGESWIEAVHFSGIVDIIAGDSIFISANQTSGASCDARIMNLSIIEL